jgi:hypothetical protein
VAIPSFTAELSLNPSSRSLTRGSISRRDGVFLAQLQNPLCEPTFSNYMNCDTQCDPGNVMWLDCVAQNGCNPASPDDSGGSVCANAYNACYIQMSDQCWTPCALDPCWLLSPLTPYYAPPTQPWQPGYQGPWYTSPRPNYVQPYP